VDKVPDPMLFRSTLDSDAFWSNGFSTCWRSPASAHFAPQA